ncbi:MAG TPA: hypothetical protein VEF05_16775 [Terriglobales bacterium]|nr:hypothetical protein [Terriglobales bacterium]
MSKSYHPITAGFTDDTREVEVRREIDNFLLALHSYPERFADDPCLSFEQYLCSIMAAEYVNGGPQRVN